MKAVLGQRDLGGGDESVVGMDPEESIRFSPLLARISSSKWGKGSSLGEDTTAYSPEPGRMVCAVRIGSCASGGGGNSWFGG
jgi:hypothetical protein